MRVLICGSRDWTDRQAIRRCIYALDRNSDIVIHGGAKGADRIAGEEAHRYGMHAAEVPALWAFNKKPAGHIRNEAMIKLLEPDRVIAFSNGSKGTQGTINVARRYGIPVEVHGHEA